jgi:drug/metabolite transporter (DMT)-like permease
MAIRTATMAFWALVMVNFVWGVGFVVVDKAIDVMPVNVFNTFRFGFAALAMLPLWWMAKKSSAQVEKEYQNKALFKTGFGLGLLLFLGFSTQTMGLQYTSVSNTGFITGLCVPLVPITGFLMFRTKVGYAVWLSVLAATIGLYFLTIGDKLELNIGDVLVAIGAVCYACHITLMARYGGKFPVLILCIIQLASVAFYSLFAASYELLQLANEFTLVQQLSDVGVLGAIAYSAILSSAFAYWVQTSSQRLLEPHKVALIFALEPIFAHIAAAIVLDEHLGIQGWFGAGLILTGMIYAELGGKKKVKIQVLEQMAAPVTDNSETT